METSILRHLLPHLVFAEILVAIIRIFGRVTQEVPMPQPNPL